MNPKRWRILLYFAAYLMVMIMLAFIYQVSHPHDPPQSATVGFQKALSNILAGQVNLFGITMIAIFTIWFITAKTSRRKRRDSN